MNEYHNNPRLTALAEKGGVMRFLIEREDSVYRGVIILSAIEENQRTRIVCMKRYRYK